MSALYAAVAGFVIVVAFWVVASMRTREEQVPEGQQAYWQSLVDVLRRLPPPTKR